MYKAVRSYGLSQFIKLKDLKFTLIYTGIELFLFLLEYFKTVLGL